jgi:hypothetical protein
VKFVLHAPAFNGDDITCGLIDRIVDRVSDEVHRVAVPDVDLLKESSWFETTRPTRRKTLMMAVAIPSRKANQERGPHVKAVEVADAGSVPLAEKLAHVPLDVLVEDREADGVFLDIIVEELGWPALRALWERSRMVTPRAMEIVSASKGNIPIRVDRAANDAASEARPLRLFVLYDSDTKWPDDDDPGLKKQTEAVQKACNKHGVPSHVWRKRCAENYIPDEVFEAVRDDSRNLSHVKRFNAFLNRKPSQRDHFPVKDGLAEKARAAAIDAGLYDLTEAAELLLLEERLFAKRPRPLLRLHQERRKFFTADGLRKRDGEGELETLLQNLAKEL